MINRGIPFEPLLGGQGTQFDALKFNYVGSPGRDTTVCAARKDAQVQTVQDLYSKELTVGGTGSGADTAIYPQFLVGAARHEVEAGAGLQGLARNPARDGAQRGARASASPMIRCCAATSRGRARSTCCCRRRSSPIRASRTCRSACRQARSPEERAALELFFARVDMGRPFVAPPDVPADRVAALRAAFQAMLKDPAFLDDAEQAAAAAWWRSPASR